jgi:phage-related minor tail protein
MAVFSVKVPTMVGVPGKYGKLKEPNPPKIVAEADAIIAGFPTVPQLARGSIANTSIALSNAEIWHICDPKSSMAFFLATKNAELNQVIQQIRDKIVTALVGDGVSPVITAIKQFVKDALAVLKVISNILTYINEQIRAAKDLIAEINFLVNVVKTLPQRVAATLAQCLALLQNALKKATTFAASPELTELITTTKTIINQSNQAVAGVNSLGTDLNGLQTNLTSVPSALSKGVASASTTLTSSLNSFTTNISGISTAITDGNGTPLVQISKSRP